MMQKIKQAFGVQDMTVGRPMDSLVRFSIPLLLGNLAQQLYNTVDSIVVGKYVGDTALAAVGTAGPILNLLIVLFMGISTGASILSAQYFGAKDRVRLSQAVGSTIVLTIASGLVMTVVGYFVSPWLVAMVTPPPEVAPGATAYLQIIFIGILGCGMYNILSGVLRGLGDSLNPLIYLVIASLMNIVLDLYFVRDLGMGVAGVAWATIIAQAVSGALCLIRLVRMRDTVDVNRQTLRLNGQLCARLTALGHCGAEPDQFPGYGSDRHQRGGHARGRLRHDAQLHLWHGLHHLYGTEHRRGAAGPHPHGHRGSDEAGPGGGRGAGAVHPASGRAAHQSVHQHPDGD